MPFFLWIILADLINTAKSNELGLCMVVDGLTAASRKVRYP